MLVDWNHMFLRYDFEMLSFYYIVDVHYMFDVVVAQYLHYTVGVVAAQLYYYLVVV